MRTLFHALLLTTAAVLFCGCFSAQAAENVYMGVQMTAVSEPPGIQVEVVRDSPAERSGLRSGDIIIAIEGTALAGDPAGFLAVMEDALQGKQVGDPLKLTVYRAGPQMVLTIDGEKYVTEDPLGELEALALNAAPGQHLSLSVVNEPATLTLTITLGARPEAGTGTVPPNEELYPGAQDQHPEVRELMDTLIGVAGIRAECDDLWRRLDARATPDDGYRLKRVSYLLRDGLKTEAMTRGLSDELINRAGEGVNGCNGVLESVREMLDLPVLKSAQMPLATGLSAEKHLEQIYGVLETAAAHVQAAFADFTDEEKAFLESQREELTDVFCWMTYIHEDGNRARMRGNLKLVEMAKRIDYQELMLAQKELARLANADYLEMMRRDLVKEFAGRLDESDLLVRDTPLGKLIISGTGHTWRQRDFAALIIDLGGDDFYTTNAGSGVSLERPVGVLIEFGGNDAYESTLRYSQGSGSMGVGMLLDLSGDDEYVGLQWCQGTGFMGGGLLLDLRGDDVYRGEELMQGAGIFGWGVKLDYDGNDYTEAQCKSQGFGGARAVGLHIDLHGDDFCYAKGKYPTNYGDPGIFDAWSQGCAQGFRGYASGGIAAMIDVHGDDYYEAGNFSQGGGYYFGLGWLHDTIGNDHYVGSRYNQGFCAHQAVGCFLEDAGDDWYQTRQAVAQGLAWDECVTMFVEAGGDDRYEGGTGFSQGASAHNSLCVFWDRGGKDTYDYVPGQARAGGNDYHGGTSLSLFIDEYGAEDIYNCEQSANNLIKWWPEYGIFCDLPGSARQILWDNAWTALIPASAE
jgi:hypothetical protein